MVQAPPRAARARVSRHDQSCAGSTTGYRAARRGRRDVHRSSRRDSRATVTRWPGIGQKALPLEEVRDGESELADVGRSISSQMPFVEPIRLDCLDPMELTRILHLHALPAGHVDAHLRPLVARVRNVGVASGRRNACRVEVDDQRPAGTQRSTVEGHKPVDVLRRPRHEGEARCRTENLGTRRFDVGFARLLSYVVRTRSNVRAFHQQHVDSFGRPADQFVEDSMLPPMTGDVARVEQAPPIRLDQ